MTSVDLANEILGLIIDHIDADSLEGRKALSACSCANYALQSMAQPRIFRDVTLSYGSVRKPNMDIVFCEDIGTSGSKFLEVITRTPLIATYVRRLIVRLTNTLDTIRCQEDRLLSETEEISLRLIVPHLTKLQQFSACNFTGLFSWQAIERRTQLLFLNAIPLVQELDLQLFYKLPLSAFHGADNLRSLRVHNYWKQEGILHPAMNKTRLDYLDIKRAYFPLEGLALNFQSSWSPFDITHLRHLRLSDSQFNHSEINEVLVICSRTLETLLLQVDALIHHPPPLHSELSGLQKLHRLMIVTSLDGIMYRPDDLINNWHFGAIFSALPFKDHPAYHPVLQVDIIFEVVDKLSLETNFPLLPWAAFGQVLDDDLMLGYIKNVNFLIKQRSYHGAQRIQSDDIKSTLWGMLDHYESLKTLRMRGILAFGGIDTIIFRS
ncbi:hypothetical protein CPB84DRAFT_1855903 [Gymnopilus junonius]|uniref:F-box domain-containing protein n=1 Tax=Gymnopilus junonius TaxID=109634 RepID=A0A9P5N8Z6_GYMJU|nr:hypothetical protein CPB84DRAFT_1855903 [Gymnopilus junonius]